MPGGKNPADTERPARTWCLGMLSIGKHHPIQPASVDSLMHRVLVSQPEVIPVRARRLLYRKRSVILIVGVVLAVVALGLSQGAQKASANTPACSNHLHNTGSGDLWACSHGADGTKYNMLCTGNLRSGPGTAYPVHGTAIGSGINHYWSVHSGTAINGGCGGPTTDLWYLSSNGWVSRSITTAAS